ncbi:hypothetical protein Sa4125_29130 [Aureimonas sp. SA4125]|uniref:lytic transglycosylase n=1 Tax=Aureimonas sp. SA4125 TaxID=2826993 RepID=UPI001CC3B35D|nr:LysM domain-containing protein [Aureimonas sp. SA4125]BDA85371.1 hypothetical protein Sa4125_29130 [Aureimonas sp. SA4125]
MHKLIPLIALTLAAGTSLGQAQDVAPTCQGNVTVERGDTLSAIAERCDLSEARILAANPSLEGSSDLVIGQRLSTETPGAQVGNRLWSGFKGAVGQTGNALESIAKGVNSSAQDILDKNPDLRSRVDSLGENLNLTGGQSSASVSVTPVSTTPEADVEVVATGLPANEAVRINVGAVGAASESVAQARTSADGTLRHVTQLPSWLPAGKQAVLTITGDSQTVLARSPRFSQN